MIQNNAYLNQFANLANVEGKFDLDISPEAGIKHWSMNENNIISYQKDDSHTLSMYLSGGEKNYRTDNLKSKGAPGKICLMPQGQGSQWEIKEKVEFVHLYFSDTLLKRYASTSFSIDVRFIELKDLLFQDDVQLQQLMSQNFSINKDINSYSPLFAEQSLHNVFHHLLDHYNGFQLHTDKIIGGLSPYHMRLVRELIHEAIDQKLTIESLAIMINLSPFHFARMFKLSFGESPANYITRVRVDKIKQLLTLNHSLAEISLLTGFNQQSHMTQNFKKITGSTPAVYRLKSKL